MTGLYTPAKGSMRLPCPLPKGRCQLGSASLQNDLVQPDLKLNAAHAGEYPNMVAQTNLWYTLKAR